MYRLQLDEICLFVHVLETQIRSPFVINKLRKLCSATPLPLWRRLLTPPASGDAPSLPRSLKLLEPARPLACFHRKSIHVHYDVVLQYSTSMLCYVMAFYVMYNRPIPQQMNGSSRRLMNHALRIDQSVKSEVARASLSHGMDH